MNTRPARTKRSANPRPAIPAPANHRPASRHQPSNWEINLPSTARAGRTEIIESRVRPLSNAELLLQRMRISSLASDTLCIVSQHDCQEEMIFTIVNHHFLPLNSAQLLLKLSECKQARPWDGASYPMRVSGSQSFSLNLQIRKYCAGIRR